MTGKVTAYFVSKFGTLDADSKLRVTFDHWDSLISNGQVPASDADQIISEILQARELLVTHVRHIEGDENLTVEEVYLRYPGIFTSRDILGVTEVLIGMHSFNLLKGMAIGLDVPELERWLDDLTPKEVLCRFESLEKWMSKYHKTNHDGNILSPLVLAYLAGEGDFDEKLATLDHLKRETRLGHFQIDNHIQRDLEFRRFVYEYTRVLEPLTYVLRGRYPPIMTNEDMYSMFVELEELPDGQVEKYVLNEKELAESRRAAHEAFEFLKFLRKFRSRTERDIIVIGNDRFGRQWFVEPIEEHLDQGFSVRYDRVRSGTSTRLSVPSVFPRKFVKELNDHMPHVVIVDGSHAPADTEVMQLSRALRDYGNWFAVFNDIRNDGKSYEYKKESSFPLGHFDELEKWHEYEAEKERIDDWVEPGLTYRVNSWAPAIKTEVMMGDERVPAQPMEFGAEQPQVVLANPIFYRTEGEDLPETLRGTTPRYFDDPDQHVSDSVIFGFGVHGLETRKKGTSTEKFVTTVQEHIKMEIRTLETQQRSGNRC